MPNTDLADDFARPACSRWKGIDPTERPHIVDKLRDVLHSQVLDRPYLTRDAIGELIEAPSGRGLPQRSVVARALERRRRRHSHRAPEGHPRRHPVTSPCGSPPRRWDRQDLLAMKQARRLARDGQRVALVWYAHGLASYLERISDNGTGDSVLPSSVSATTSAIGGAPLRGAEAGPDESLRPQSDGAVLGTRPAGADDLFRNATRCRAPVRCGRRR